MSESVKLTKAQHALLNSMTDGGPVYAVPSYAPAKALVAKGCAEWTKVAFPRLRITEAGRAALKDTPQ